MKKKRKKIRNHAFSGRSQSIDESAAIFQFHWGGWKFQSSVTVECKLRDVTLSFTSVQMGLSFQLRI